MSAGIALLSVLAAAVPTALFVLFFWWLDRYEKEPRALFLGAFAWGAVPAVIVSLLMEAWLGRPFSVLGAESASVLTSTLIAPPVEELAKGLALWGLYHWAHAEFDGPLDGIVYGAVVGLGFAMVENIFYFWSAFAESGVAAWLTLIPVRAVAFGLNHALFTAFTGLGLARARYSPSRGRRWRAALGGLAVAMGVHLVHNLLAGAGLCALSLAVNWMGVALILVVAVMSWRREAEWMREYLREEVTLGVLSESLYEALCSRGRRYWAAMRRQQGDADKAGVFKRLASDAAELAQKKHQLARMGDERGNGAAIAQLRTRIREERALLGE
ncbi:MAG: PrsW family intramembrane metalloprotease [Anaerolineales bacterium]